MISREDLREVTFSITNKCNLRCPWCFENSSNVAKNNLSTKDIISVFDKIKGLSAINLTGGEIFVHKDIKEILSAATGFFSRVHLITNGILIPKELLDFFKVNNISFGISVDGSKIIHERTRGSNTFDQTINNIRLLRENGLYVNMQMTVSRMNINEVDYLVSLGNKLGVNRVSFIRLKGVGRGEPLSDLILNTEETKLLNEKILDVRKQQGDQIPYIMLKDSFFNTLDDSLIRESERLGPSYICGGCRAGMEILHISSSGDIFPCPYLKILLGNVMVDNVFDIFVNHPILQSLRQKEKYAKCQNCSFWNICRGCRAESMRVSGNYLGTDPQCWR